MHCLLTGPQIIAKRAVTKMSAKAVTIHDRQPRAARPYFEHRYSTLEYLCFEQGAETKTILTLVSQAIWYPRKYAKYPSQFDIPCQVS